MFVCFFYYFDHEKKSADKSTDTFSSVKNRGYKLIIKKAFFYLSKKQQKHNKPYSIVKTQNSQKTV